MKKFLFTLMLFCIIGLIQNVNAQNYGIQAGLNLSNLSIRDSEGKFDSKSIAGVNIGFLMEILQSKGLTIEMGGKIATYGMMRTTRYGQLTTDYKIKANYFEIPLYLKKELYSNDKVSLLGIAGGYGSFGLSGTMYEDGDGYKISWKTGEDGLKRYDFGLIAGVGVRMSSFTLLVNYNFGLNNLSLEESPSDLKINNRVLGLSIIYNFKN